MRQPLHIRTLLTLGLIIIAHQVLSAEPPKEITNNIGMKFKLIPAGEFMMGGGQSPDEVAKTFPGIDLKWFQNELPRHKVRITRPFFLSITEVTQQQYETVMGKNPSSFSPAGEHATIVAGANTSDFPVESVSWEDAVEFCRRLANLPEEKAAGRTYRLPTEAEWEYACRAGSTTRYHFGDEESRLHEFAWYGEMVTGPHPVGRGNRTHGARSTCTGMSRMV